MPKPSDLLPQGEKVKGSHKRQCSICLHDNLEQIETDFCYGRPIGEICQFYKIKRTCLYNHMEKRGLSDFRKKNPLFRMQWLAEDLADKVQYRGSDVVKMLEDLAKSEGQLLPDNQVNINQQIATLGEQLRGVSDNDIKRMKELIQERIKQSNG